MLTSYIEENGAVPLFRFVSFFDLYDILVNRRLRFSKLASMPDKNEGIGSILRGQENAIFRHVHIDPARIPTIHESVLENHYISCWTMEPESMAMWSLYSPDSMSIRISTTVAKLNTALTELFEDMLWTHCANEPGTRKHVAWYNRLEPVKYVNYVSLRDEIRCKYSAFRDRANASSRLRTDYFEAQDGFMKDWTEFTGSQEIHTDGLFLKDDAFFHEKEVRACLYCGVRNDKTLETFREEKGMASLFTQATTGELPSFIYGKLNSSFLDSVCFDPRMPRYKRLVYQGLLSTILPVVTESRCFGYLLNQVDFSSDFDGNVL